MSQAGLWNHSGVYFLRRDTKTRDANRRAPLRGSSPPESPLCMVCLWEAVFCCVTAGPKETRSRGKRGPSLKQSQIKQTNRQGCRGSRDVGIS